LVKSLMLYFLDAAGKKRTIKLDTPRDDITEEEVLNTMNLIIEKDIFTGPALISPEGAAIVTVHTTELDLDQVV